MKKIILFLTMFVMILLFAISVNSIGCLGQSCIESGDVSSANLDFYYNFNDTNTNLVNYASSGVSSMTCSNTPTIGQTDPFGGTNAYDFDRASNEFCRNTTTEPVMGFAADFTINYFLKFEDNTSEQYNIQMSGGPYPQLRYNSIAQYDMSLQVGAGTIVHPYVPPPTWQMFTARRNATHQAMFINGTEIVAGTLAPADLPDLQIVIAEEISGGVHNFDGLMAELSMFNRALTSDEILCMWNGNCGTQPENNSPSISNCLLTSDHGTGDLRNWTTDITPTGNCTITNDNTVVMIRASNDTSFEDDKDLVLYLPFDDYGRGESDKLTAIDQSKKGNDGTLNGYTFNDGLLVGATLNASNGYYENGAGFDGIGNTILIPSTTYNLVSGFTFSYWAKRVGSFSLPQYVLGRNNRFLSYCGFGADNRMRCETNTNGDLILGTTVLLNSDWHYYTISCVGQVCDIYLDGINDTSDAFRPVAETITFDRISSNSTSNVVFNGSIDEVRIWNKALNITEINWEMNSSQPVSSQGLISSWTFNEKASNSTHAYDTNNIGLAANFTVKNGEVINTSEGGIVLDGIDDYVDLPNINTISPTKLFTVTGWFNTRDITSFGNIISHGAGNNNRFAINIDASGNIASGIFNGTSYQSSRKGGAVVDNQWNYFAYVYDGDGTAILYLNNIVQVTVLTPVVDNDVGTVIGVRQDLSSTTFFNGSIDEVFIFNRSLTLQEINGLYNQSKHYSKQTEYDRMEPKRNGTDGGSNEWVWTILGLDNLAENSNRLCFTAISNLGLNSTVCNATMEVFADSIAPNITIHLPINNTIVNFQAIELNFTANDTGIGIDTIAYSLDGAVNVTVTTNVTISGLSIGNHKIDMMVNDTLGNIIFSGINFTVDDILPEVQIIYPTDGLTTDKGTLDFNWSARDLNSGLDTVWYSLNVGTNTTVTTNTTITGFIEGLNSVNLYANDTLGNMNNISSTFTIIFNCTFNDGWNNTIYEYETNATLVCSVSSAVIVDINVDTFNVVGGVDFAYDIDTLRQNLFEENFLNVSFSADSSSWTLVNPQTDIVQVKFGAEGIKEGGNFPFNSRISIESQVFNLKGTLDGIWLFTDLFLENNIEAVAFNISFSAAGSEVIEINVSTASITTDSDLFKNVTFQYSGFSVDVGNNLDFFEYFNDTNRTSNFVNITSTEVSAPLGLFDNFENNDTTFDRWVTTGCTAPFTNCNHSVNFGEDDDYFFLYDAKEGFTSESTLTSIGMAVNSHSIIQTKIDLRAHCQHNGGCSADSKAENIVYITDGTSSVLLFNNQILCSPGSGKAKEFNGNFTLVNQIGTNNWELFLNDVVDSIVDLSALNSDKTWDFRVTESLTCPSGQGCNCQSTGQNVWVKLYKVSLSGVKLNNSDSTVEYDGNGTFVSKTIFVAPFNVSVAKIIPVEIKPDGTDIDYFLSNDDCNTLVESLPNTRTVLFSPDNNRMCVVFNLTTDDLNVSPQVLSYNLQITPGNVAGILIDVTNNNIIDCEFGDTLNESNSPQNCTVDSGTIFSSIEDDKFKEVTTIPITITISSSGGIVEVSNLNVTQNVSTIVANNSVIENVNNITINTTTSQGNLTLFDLRFDFKGSKNISLDIGGNNFVLRVKYSKFNITMPPGVKNFNVFVPTVSFPLNASNIDPHGQIVGDYANWSMPIFNVTSEAYEDPMDCYEFTDESIDSCITIFGANNFDFNNTYTLNTTGGTDLNLTNVAANLNINASENVFLRLNFTNCGSALNLDFVPKWNCWCSDCVFVD